MADDKRLIEMPRVAAGPFRAAHIGGCKGEVWDVQLVDIWDEEPRGVQVIHRHIKKSLNLIGVEIHCDYAIDM